MSLQRSLSCTFSACLAAGILALWPAGGSAGGMPAAGQSNSGPLGLRAHTRPNIVMVMADDMRVDDLRFAPYVRALIGGHGLNFRNSFAPYPLCVPSRASFLTGQYAHNHGDFWHDPPYGYAAFDDSRTLGTALHAAGYRTGFVGKYVNGYGRMLSRVTGGPSARYVPRGWGDWRASVDGAPGVHGGTYSYFDIAFNANGRIDNTHHGQYSSAVIGDTASAMARRFASGRSPFFMYVNFVAPHNGGPQEPGDPPQYVADRHGRRWNYGTPGRPAWVKGMFNSVIGRGAGMPRNGGPAEADVSDKPGYISSIPEPTPRERLLLRDVTRQRVEAVHVMDFHIARLIHALRRSGEWSNTVFMFTSDNGYFLGEHRWRTGKVLAHEPSLRVPFLVTGPGMRARGKRFDPISTVDVTATILDLAHARPPRRPDGTSRLTTMRHGDQGWRTTVVTESATPGDLPRVHGFHDARTAIGLRTYRYSLMVNRRGGDELYDLARDPLENHNVFRASRYRPVRRVLLTEWNALRNCSGRTCQAPLARSLQASPAAEARLTRRYWTAIDATYGWK
jgi:N-acetylglucosamine-6-sulfatase